MTYRKQIVALTGAAGMVLSASTALAQTTTVACNDTSVLPNPIFMAGSSAFEPILSQLAVQIKAKQNVSIVYDPISSCLGVSSVSPPADNPVPQPLTGTAHYYTVDPTDGSKTVINSCNLSGNTMASVGISDVAFDSCQGVAKPATIGEWAGPVQSMLIIVPKANFTTTSISSQQAAAIWGCGKQSGVGNFTDETAIQQRSQTSGTQILIARNIGVPESALSKALSGAAPDAMAMGTSGMADMATMAMPLPPNTLPMMTGTGPFGAIEMGGMFSVLKVRETLAANDYGDPGWYQHPPGTVAHEVNMEAAGEPARQLGASESPPTEMPGMDMPGMKTGGRQGHP